MVRLGVIFWTYHVSQCQQEAQGGVGPLPTRQLTHVIHLSEVVTIVCLAGQVQRVIRVVEFNSSREAFPLKILVEVHPDYFCVMLQFLAPHALAHLEIFLVVFVLLVQHGVQRNTRLVVCSRFLKIRTHECQGPSLQAGFPPALVDLFLQCSCFRFESGGSQGGRSGGEVVDKKMLCKVYNT